MKYLNKIIESNYKILLVLTFAIAVLLRWIYLPSGAISFAYDQARDAFVVLEILHGHLKVLGPPVSGVPGLFHGVLYYYVIAPAYLLGHGNPIVVAYFLSFISSLAVFAVFYLTKLLTKSNIPSILAALIFAFSFEASQYANLMTNASMGVWFVPIFYIGLYLWITKSFKWAPLITGLSLGFAIQSEVALAYHLFPLFLWLFIFKNKINKKDFLIFSLSFVVAISSMIIAEIKFGFTGTNGILYLLSGQDGIVQAKNFSDYIITLLDQSGKTFAYTLFPISIVFGGLVGFTMVISSIFLELKNIKEKLLTWQTFLISWIFAYAIALPFGGWNMKHILVGVAPAVSIYGGIFIWKFIGKEKLLAVLFIICILATNSIKILKENKNGQTIFPLQLDLTLGNEMKVVDFTYQKANKQPFSISTLTSPLFVNTLWSYVYNWYGKSKYGYLPYWVGHNQIDQLGDDLQFAPSTVSQHFYIIEPTYGIPDIWVNYAKGDQDAISTLITQKNFGQIVVQDRKIINKK